MNSAQTALIGESSAMKRLRELVTMVAPTRIPVLIEGETGTGKELIAEMLHSRSQRTGAFVAFNVCALGESMFEDSLFGHVKGAYTGAAAETLGFLREANGGTAFFDEISGLSMGLQSKLLRAVETGVVRPIGSSRDARSDFRTIAATNESLDELVSQGRFRADLAHRLSGMVLRMPTLAERLDDVPLLVDHFLRTARPNRPPSVTPDVIRMLQDRAWPGNIRQLRQVVETAVVFCGEVLTRESISTILEQRAIQRIGGSSDARVLERQRLLQLLHGSKWDTELAATSLGVHRTTIYRRMRRLGIGIPSSFERSHAAASSIAHLHAVTGSRRSAVELS